MLALVHVGSRFATQAPPGSPIRAGLSDPSVTEVGYDGQFYYYIALDPAGAACCVEAPAYRYTRIGYPLAARALALGIPALVPAAMLAINLAAIAFTVALLAAWLRRKGLSGWWALVYGFYPGLFQAFQADVTEPMSYALVAAAIFTLEFGGRRRLLWGGLLFALAALTRETTLIFPAVYAVAAAVRTGGGPARRLATGLGLSLLAAGPLVAYKAFLTVRFGSLGVGFKSGSEFATSPLGGLLSFHPFEAQHWIQLVCEAVPATLIALLAVYQLWRGPRPSELAAYLVNYVFLVLLLQRSSYSTYVDSGRIQTGVVLAAILALPVLLGAPRAAVESRPARSPAPALVGIACLLWLGVALPGVAAPHTFHAFKL
jgi:hypothetical protein